MKRLKKITLFIALVALFASCQSGTDVTKILSNQDTKKAIMDSIANDSNLSVEMMETIMNGKMMQNNPAMMQSMMSGMMETCCRDSAMMSSMCSSIMNNPQMMDMIHKNMGGKMDMKGMNNMDGMNHQMK